MAARVVEWRGKRRGLEERKKRLRPAWAFKEEGKKEIAFSGWQKREKRKSQPNAGRKFP